MDELYFMSRGKAKIDIEELDLRETDGALLEAYANKFPDYMRSLVTGVKKYNGTTPATLETKERIAWKEPVTA